MNFCVREILPFFAKEEEEEEFFVYFDYSYRRDNETITRTPILSEPSGQIVLNATTHRY